eukprot:5136808-Pleurochrysis_carterae.AAC.1
MPLKLMPCGDSLLLRKRGEEATNIWLGDGPRPPKSVRRVVEAAKSKSTLPSPHCGRCWMSSGGRLGQGMGSKGNPGKSGGGGGSGGNGG